MSIMLELVSMIRPFGHWHFLLAVCLLDLALIAVHVTNQQDRSEAELKERLDKARRELADQEEINFRLLGRVTEMKNVMEERRRRGLEVLSDGVRDLETRMGRLSEMLENKNNGDDGENL